MKYCVSEIQFWFRAVLLRQRFQRLKKAAYKLITWSRMQLHRRRFTEAVRSATVIQALVRGKEPRDVFCEKRTGQVVISRWWRAVLLRLYFIRTKEAATVMTVWARSRVCRHRYRRVLTAITKLQARNRSQKLRREFVDTKQAAQMITSWSQSFLLRQQYQRKRAAEKMIAAWSRCWLQRSAFIKTKRASTVLSAWYRSRKERTRFCQTKTAAAIVRIRRRSLLSQQMVTKRRSAAMKIQAVVRTRLQKNRLSAADELAHYKKQVNELQSIIANITSESAHHIEEVEAEYEERLGEYEEEVLILQQTIERNEEEKLHMKDEIAANVENVGNLKTGIQSMQESHREYLNKVMRAIEKANADHSRALEMIKQDRDTRVNELKAEIKMLKEGNHPAIQKRQYDVYRLARKLEKLIAPDYILAMADKAGANGMTTEECVEQKVSSKARKIVYRLEDIAKESAGTPRGVEEQTRNEAEKDRVIEKLQQQLVRAYEEIESMQQRNNYESRVETEALRSGKSPKKGLRRVFHR